MFFFRHLQGASFALRRFHALGFVGVDSEKLKGLGAIELETIADSWFEKSLLGINAGIPSNAAIIIESNNIAVYTIMYAFVNSQFFQPNEKFNMQRKKPNNHGML